MKIPHELVTVIEERRKTVLFKVQVTVLSMGRPFRALIHKPGDLPAVCTEAFASMPRVKLAVRFTYTLSLAMFVRLVPVWHYALLCL